MVEMAQKVLVKALLKGEDVTKFKAVKRFHGLLHNSEVVRICINKSYKELRKED